MFKTKKNSSKLPKTNSHKEIEGKIEKLLESLTINEKEIIKLRYGINDGYAYNYEEIGRIFKMTRRCVRQIETRALRKIRNRVG